MLAMKGRKMELDYGETKGFVTFSNKDFSASFEVVKDKDAVKEKRAFVESMIPESVKKLKERGFYVKALEEVAEELPNAFVLVPAGKPVKIRVDFCENGDIMMYSNSRLVTKKKMHGGDMHIFLVNIRRNLIGRL